MINLDEKFKLINNICFKGDLPQILIKIKSRANVNAAFVVDTDELGNNTYSIELNPRLSRGGSDLEPILLHEMVHFWIALNRPEEMSEEHSDGFEEKAAEVGKIWWENELKSL